MHFFQPYDFKKCIKKFNRDREAPLGPWPVATLCLSQGCKGLSAAGCNPAYNLESKEYEWLKATPLRGFIFFGERDVVYM
jgi:hypothetical protein